MTKPNRPPVSVIVAVDEQRGIGKNGKIPWHISEDLLYYRRKTLNRVIIIGQKSFDWMIGYYRKSRKPLPRKTHLVLTADRHYRTDVPDTIVVHSIKQALEIALGLEKKEVFIAGGGQIYSQMLKYADRLYLTLVKGNYQADTFFPDYSEFSKIISKRESRDKHYQYTFFVLERPKPASLKP